MTITLDQLKLSLKTYNDSYRRDNFEDLKFGELYDLFPSEEKGEEKDENAWPSRWPNCYDAGVYAFLAPDQTVRYIGKSTNRQGMGFRLSKYCSSGLNKACVLNGDWVVKPKYIITVPARNDMRFEAAGLEEYLISELNPPENTVGKR